MLFWLLASALLAAGQNTTGHWQMTLPDGDTPEISFLSGPEDTQYTVPSAPSADHSVPTVHIVPGLDGVFEETLIFSGYMVFTADSEEVTLRQEYNDEHKITAVRITTSAPVTLFCHGEGYFIGREAPPDHHLLITEPPFSPSCQGNRIELSSKEHHWLVFNPASSQFKTGKLLADELLQDMSIYKDSFLPESGIKIIAFPGELGISSSGGGGGGGKGTGGGGGKKDPWASYKQNYDDSSAEEGEDGEEGDDGKACPNCKVPPCPDCGKPHCREWQFKRISEASGQSVEEVKEIIRTLFIASLVAKYLQGNGGDHSQ